MSDFRFTLIVATPLMGDEQILDVTDALGEAGCTDASIRGHAGGMELLFSRKARTLQAAIASAIADVERSGHRVARVVMEREAITL